MNKAKILFIFLIIVIILIIVFTLFWNGNKKKSCSSIGSDNQTDCSLIDRDCNQDQKDCYDLFPVTQGKSQDVVLTDCKDNNNTKNKECNTKVVCARGDRGATGPSGVTGPTGP